MRRAAPLAALLLTAPAGAQNLQPWPTVQLQVPVAGHWSLSGETVQRLSADDRRPGQWRLRGYLNYQPVKRLTLSLGYGRLLTYQATGGTAGGTGGGTGGGNGLENQVNEQALWQPGRLGGVRIVSRTRLEQRFQRGDDGVSWRLREQLRGEVPTGGGTAPSLVLWSEPFVVVRATRLAPAGLAQIRNFAGVSVPVGPHATAEFGYLNQHQFRAAGDLSTNAVPLILLFHF